jgi:hypothetical protein
MFSFGKTAKKGRRMRLPSQFLIRNKLAGTICFSVVWRSVMFMPHGMTLALGAITLTRSFGPTSP